jgi:hypothetical protein
MRPTDPMPPRGDRASDELLEELCIALRDIAVRTQFLPYREPDPDIAKEVDRVQAVAQELSRREVDPMTRLGRLTAETGWDMAELFGECRRYPSSRPWVRATSDGLRIAMRCLACGQHEFPAHSRRIRLCDECLAILDAAIASKSVADHLLLYRTYTKDARCAHADDDTVIGVYPWSPEWSEDFPIGLCRVCVAEEAARRKSRLT